MIRPSYSFNPAISTPICFAPPLEVPPPPPPQVEPETNGVIHISKSNELNEKTQEASQHVDEPSTSNASQPRSATLQLPYPNVPVLVKRDYEKPV